MSVLSFQYETSRRSRFVSLFNCFDVSFAPPYLPLKSGTASLCKERVKAVYEAAPLAALIE